jgi:hypothetical protein
MMSPVRKWGVPTLVVALPLGMILPVFAQHAREQAGHPNQMGQVADGRQIAKLIEQGQLNMSDATETATRHVKGVAIRAECEVQMGQIEAGERDREQGSADSQSQPGEQPDRNRTGNDQSNNQAGNSQPGNNQSGNNQPGRERGANERSGMNESGQRLVYEITCFVEDKNQVEVVRVDGKTKKVIQGGDTNVRPNQPSQPDQPGQPNRPTQPGQPNRPTQPQ